jgi:hypothetical protein
MRAPHFDPVRGAGQELPICIFATDALWAAVDRTQTKRVSSFLILDHGKTTMARRVIHIGRESMVIAGYSAPPRGSNPTAMLSLLYPRMRYPLPLGDPFLLKANTLAEGPRVFIDHPPSAGFPPPDIPALLSPSPVEGLFLFAPKPRFRGDSAPRAIGLPHVQ